MQTTNPFTNETENTEMTVRSRDIDFAGEITKVESSFCSLTPETLEEKKLMFNAISNTQEVLKDHVNEELTIIGFYLEEVTVIDEKTGEEKKVPRIVLIDENMTGYGCASFGIFNSLKKLVQMLGMPTQQEPYRLKVRNRSLKNNYTTITLELA